MHNADPYAQRDRTWSPSPGPLARGPRPPGRRTLPSQYLVSRPSRPRRSRPIMLIGVAVLSLCGLGLGFVMAYGSVPMPSLASRSGQASKHRSHTGGTAPVAEAEADADATGGWAADDGAAETPRSSPAVRTAPEAPRASGPTPPSEPTGPGTAARPPAKATEGAKAGTKGTTGNGKPGTAGKAGKPGNAGKAGKATKPVRTPAKSGGRPPAAPAAVEHECARRFPGDPTRQRACAAALHGVFGRR